MEKKEIVTKWYKRLELPQEMDEVFYKALDRVKIEDGVTAENIPSLVGLGEAGAILSLYFCENMEKEYKSHGIEYRFENDIKRVRNRLVNAYKNTGTLDVGDLTWERHYLMAREFRIGRLIFTLGKSPTNVESKGIKQGDPVLQVHVPGGEPLLYEACVSAINEVREFVREHFPEFNYRYLTCLSWLLDSSVKDLLGEGSNVLKFASLFEKVASHPSDNILKFVFGGGTTRENLHGVEPVGRFQRVLKESALAGRVFYDVRGVIAIDKVLPETI